MIKFNNSSRTKNVIRTSVISSSCNIINILLGFVYRTIFISLLSASYLGINGLFTNILQILSFAELGISTAIDFRLYEPVMNRDITKIGKLMNFYKSVYRAVALVIFLAGMAIYPFIDHFVKDSSEIPPDVNLSFIFLLYLAQTISSYAYVYRQTLLNADQRYYIVAAMQTILNFMKYFAQVLILWLYRDFTMSLIISILTTVLFNILTSVYVTKQYPDVFRVKEKLSLQEQKEIISDTKATLLHKIGGTVLTSTDSLVLSRFAGLVATGLYSNYYLILGSLNGLLSRLLGSFTSTIGNAHFSQSEEDKYVSYRRLLFLNLWIVGLCTVCIYNLIDDFIIIWLGSKMRLDNIVVIALSLQFFLEASRYISTSYVIGGGLFVKDKIRPLIEAGVNIGVSIFLVRRIGIAGVFFGTSISHLTTVFWREPYILFRYDFKKSVWVYWKDYVVFSLITLAATVLISGLKRVINLSDMNLFLWIGEAVVCALVYGILSGILLGKSDGMKFYAAFLKKLIRKT